MQALLTNLKLHLCSSTFLPDPLHPPSFTGRQQRWNGSGSHVGWFRHGFWFSAAASFHSATASAGSSVSSPFTRLLQRIRSAKWMASHTTVSDLGGSNHPQEPCFHDMFPTCGLLGITPWVGHFKLTSSTTAKSYEAPVCMLWSWLLPAWSYSKSLFKVAFSFADFTRETLDTYKTFPSRFLFVPRSKSADCSDKRSVCHVLCLKATIPEGSDTHKHAHTLSDLCSVI